MKLAIDIGNTFIKCGIFHKQKIVDRASVQSAEELLSFFKKYKLSKIILSSVVPNKSKEFINYLNRRFNLPLYVVNYKNTNLKLKVQEPSSVGNDRVCNIFSAIKLYSAPLIVIDFGTATTYDVVNSREEFIGGIIAPGVETSAENLISKAALLDDISFDFPSKVIGNNTKNNIQSGLMFGAVSQVEGLVNKIETESKTKYTVILTGGFSSLLSSHLNTSHLVDVDLTLKGMFYIEELFNK
tara:strand:- start:303 stop:1025 length:723 start_codon:yes stop_codon:yes gene_type:complete